MFETERLILRKIIKEDFEELHKLFRDPEVMQYVADIKAEKDTTDWISIVQINPFYSVNSNPPRKIKFNSNLSIPVEAYAFCFSYSGEFKGDGSPLESLYIGKDPFH